MTILYTQELDSTDGFDITFNALVEHVPLEDTLDCTEKELINYYKKIDNGELAYFCAEVVASRNGIRLGDDFLGCCLYASYEDSIKEGDHIQDMIQMVVKEAKYTLTQLYTENQRSCMYKPMR